MNSGQLRSGKHIIDSIGEATKSHQLIQNLPPYLNNELKISSPLLNISTFITPSIILFESVDLIFEEDKGFFQALKNLIHNTKTPIILTCNGE